MQNKKRYLISILICLTLAAMGCQTAQTPPRPLPPVSPAPVCESLEDFNRVGPAIEAAKRNLARQECGDSFQKSYETLIGIAEENQGSSNPDLFAAFINWGYEQNILSKTDANTLYREYFSTKFIALPDDIRVCDAASTKNFKRLESALKKELAKKDKGLAKAAGNRDAYRRAHDQMNQVLNIIEGVGMACAAQ